MDRIQEERDRIFRWMEANRRGEDSDLPCFWSIYALNSITGQPPKSGHASCNNLTIENAAESVDYLIERMNDTPHVKAFAVRLRSKKGDIGLIANFQNPYYTSNHSLSGVRQNDGIGNMNMTIIGMLQKQMEDRMQIKEESTQATLLMMQKQNEMFMESFRKEMEFKAELKALREENESLKGVQPQNALLEFLSEVKPEISNLLKYKISGHIPYPYKEAEASHDDDEPEVAEEKKNQLVTQSIDLMKNRVQRPEEIMWKLAFVLDNMKDEEAKSLINMLHSNYEAIKSQKSNE